MDGPGYLTAPPLNLELKVRIMDMTYDMDPMADREDRDKVLKELYGRLQTLYPGVDPKKEPQFQRTMRPGQPPQGAMLGQRPVPNQMMGQSSPVT